MPAVPRLTPLPDLPPANYTRIRRRIDHVAAVMDVLHVDYGDDLAVWKRRFFRKPDDIDHPFESLEALAPWPFGRLSACFTEHHREMADAARLEFEALAVLILNTLPSEFCISYACVRRSTIFNMINNKILRNILND